MTGGRRRAPARQWRGEAQLPAGAAAAAAAESNKGRQPRGVMEEVHHLHRPPRRLSGVGESFWPAAASAGGGGYTDIRKEIFDHLIAKGIEEVVSDPPAFREQLDRHFERLPASYSIDLDVEKAEDVLLHRRILDKCADPDKCPVFHVRFLRCMEAPVDSEDKPHDPSTRDYGSTSR